MIATVFVDTNVLVHARNDRDPARQRRASAWLAQLWRTGAGRLSSQVLSEYYQTVTRKLVPSLGSDEAWDDVQSLMRWNPQSIDAELLKRAREVEQRYRLSWWDGMIVAAAQLQACALLLTEDLQDRAKFDGVEVRNPFKLAIEEAQASYGLASMPMIRHRKPGRPLRMRA